MSIVRHLPLAFLLATAPAIAQDKHQLRLRFVPDTVVHYVMKQDMDMSMNMGGQDMGTKMKMQMFMTTKVGKVEGNTAELTQEITRVKVEMKNPMMGGINYDSADEDSDPGMLSGLEEMVGQKIKVKIDDMGKLVDFKMDGEGAESTEKAGVDLKQMMSQSLVMLPAAPVGIDETWQSETKLPMGQMGDMDVKVTNKLLNVDKDHFTVEQVMNIDASDVEMPGGMKVDSMESKGTSKVDLRTGMPSEMTTELKMKMSGAMAMSMTVKQTVEPAPAPEPKKTEETKKADGGK